MRKFEGFHIINLYIEDVSPTSLLLQYMKVFWKWYKIKAFIASNMKDLITFLDNNIKPVIYTGETFMDSIII